MPAYRNCQVVAAGKLGDFAFIPEASPHDNGTIAILLIVVEDGLHALDTWIVLRGVILLHCRLVPIQDSADERRNKVGTSLRCGDCLWEGEHQGQVTIDAVLCLQSMCSLDTFPCGCKLDEDP